MALNPQVKVTLNRTHDPFKLDLVFLVGQQRYVDIVGGHSLYKGIFRLGDIISATLEELGGMGYAYDSTISDTVDSATYKRGFKLTDDWKEELVEWVRSALKVIFAGRESC